MSYPLIPLEQFTIVCFRPKDEIVKILSKSIDRKEEGRFIEIFTGTDVPFHGLFTSDIFTIKRKISYRNDFNPVLAGRLHGDGIKTSIEVSARMEDQTLIFMGAWLFVFLSAIMITAFGDASRDTTLWAASMFMAGYIISMVAFALELRKAKRLLLEIVKGIICQ